MKLVLLNGSTALVGLCSCLRFLDHNKTDHSLYEFSGWVIGRSQRPLSENAQHSQEIDVHDTSEFEPAVSASGRPQTHAVDRASTDIYRVIQEESAILLEIIVCVILSNISYKYVSDFRRLRSYGYFLIPVHALVWTALTASAMVWRTEFGYFASWPLLARFTTERLPVSRPAVAFSKTSFKDR
jgi:hypothetical protein